MCFSATASFTVAASTGLVGIMTLRHVRSPREVALASFPVLFALQQSIEGVLWLQLTNTGAPALTAGLANAFVAIANVIWPVLAPVAVYLVEPDRRRQWIMSVCGAIGGLYGLAVIVVLVDQPYAAVIVGRSIQYVNSGTYGPWWKLPYFTAAVVPLLSSSHALVQALGSMVVVGFLTTAIFYVDSLISVWCFFAAISSLVLLFQFLRGLETFP